MLYCNDFMLLTKQSGIIKPFAYVLGYIMQGIFWLLDKVGFPNIALAIILFTIICYVLLIPLTIKQMKFSKLSSKMNPELTAIREKYNGKTDQDSMMRMNAETKLIYEKYGVSASGSCVQLLIQIPIIWALYRIVYNIPAYIDKIKNAFFPLVNNLVEKTDSVEFIQTFKNAGMYKKQFDNEIFLSDADYKINTFIDVLNRASSTEWASISDKYPDLAAQVTQSKNILDQYNSFFGLNISDSPSFYFAEEMAKDSKSIIFIIGILMFPVLAALTQWLSMKLTPQPNSDGNGSSAENSMAQSMKTMNTIMPLFSAFMCYSLPVGVCIYWIVSAVVRTIINIFINRSIDKIDVDEMVANNMKKIEEKRAKLGIPASQISANATLSTKKIDNKNSSDKDDDNSYSGKISSNVKNKDSSEYYENENRYKEGSLASKAFLVKEYNEKNNVKNND